MRKETKKSRLEGELEKSINKITDETLRVVVRGFFADNFKVALL